MPPAPSGCPRSCSRPVQPRSQRHHIAALTGSTTRAPSTRFPFPHTGHAARALTGSGIGPRGLLGAPALWDLTVVRCCGVYGSVCGAAACSVSERKLRFGGLGLVALPGTLRGKRGSGPSDPVCAGRGLRAERGLSRGLGAPRVRAVPPGCSRPAEVPYECLELQPKNWCVCVCDRDSGGFEGVWW